MQTARKSAVVTVFSAPAERMPATRKPEGIPSGDNAPSFAFDALFRLNPQIMWVHDRDTLRFLEVNDAAIAHYGYSREEFLSLSLPDIRPAEDVPSFLAKMAQLTEDNSLFGEVRHYTKDGRLFHAEVHGRAVPFAGKRAVLAIVQDITARKQAEQERERLLEELRYIAGGTRCFFWQAEIEARGSGKGLHWRMTTPAPENAVRLFPVAIDPGENFFFAWYKSRLEADRIATNAHADQQIRTGKSFSREFRYRTHDNDIRWAGEDVTIEVIEPGEKWRAIGVCTDITERKQTEKTLRYVMDTAQCLLWYAEVERLPDDETGVNYHWRLSIPTGDTAAQRFLPLEVPPDSDYAWAWGASRHPDDEAEMLQRAHRHLSRNEGYSQEFRCFDKYGKVHWLKEDVHVEPLAPERWRSVGVCTDVTRLKDAEEGRKIAVDALAASEERYRSVVERVRDVIFQTDARGRCIFLNDAWEEITGFTVAESLGRSLTGLVEEGHRAAYDRAWAVLQGGGSLPGPCEICCRSGSGAALWLEVSAMPTFDTQGGFSGILGTIRDVTERKRMQAQLIRTEKLVALGELAAGVAHEINNPLSVASAMAQFLEMHHDPDVQGDAATIRRMVDRIARIVHSLRVFSYDGRPAAKRPVAISAIIENALTIVGAKLRQAEARVECVIADGLPKVTVNEGEIEQVLVNLLINAEHALHAVPPEARSVRISAYHERVGAGAGEGWLHLAVQDSGGGIADEVKGRIFDPFFTTKDIGEGTGLGLSICHGIIQSHEGTIAVESALGHGATFTVSLPIHDAPDFTALIPETA